MSWVKLALTLLSLMKWASSTHKEWRAFNEGERKERLRQLEALVGELRGAAGVGEWYSELSESQKLELLEREKWYTH